jgi:hypothetical protein
MYDTKFEIRIVIDGNGNPYELIITC